MIRAVLVSLALLIDFTLAFNEALPAGRVTDTQITDNVRRLLHADFRVRDDSIDVTTSNGWVTLKGDVTSVLSRYRVEQLSKKVAGVKGVRNQIQKNDPRVLAADITVAAQDRCVTLHGSVPSLHEKQLAQRIVRSVIGVVRIDNHLNVIGEDRADGEIQSDIEASFASDSLLHGQRVKVSVHQGVAILSGEVQDFSSKFQAFRVASGVRGVRAITNETRVSPAARIGDDAISRLVVSRLRANAVTRSVADRINVRTEDGVVELTGEVATWSHRAEAGNAARFTDGVRRVDNQLTVAESQR
jgi:osmotically-inducible protein OsmY